MPLFLLIKLTWSLLYAKEGLQCLRQLQRCILPTVSYGVIYCSISME